MNDVFFFFSHSKKKTFCMQKNRTKSSFFLSVLLKILLREVIRPFGRSILQKKTKKKKLIKKREKKTIIKKSKT